MSNDKRVRFYLFLPDESRIELKQVLFSAGSDGCEFWFSSDAVDAAYLKKDATKDSALPDEPSVSPVKIDHFPKSTKNQSTTKDQPPTNDLSARLVTFARALADDADRELTHHQDFERTVAAAKMDVAAQLLKALGVGR